MKYLKLIRYPNLLLISFVQLVIRYGLFEPLGLSLSLSNFQYFILILCTLSLAAAGNVINDIFDIDIDSINNPDKVIIGKTISEKTAYNLFLFFNVLGVGLGFYLANTIQQPFLAALFIIISATLYVYASYLKGIPFLGNVVISILVSLSIIIVGLFDLMPAITFLNKENQSYAFKLLLQYSLFAFIINLIREIVKDIEDINGDKNGGLQTLPIVLGRKRAAMIAFSLGILSLFGTVYYIYMYLYNFTAIILYFLLCIIGPLLYFCTKIWDASKRQEFQKLSILLKIIMFLGISSLLFYPFVTL